MVRLLTAGLIATVLMAAAGRPHAALPPHHSYTVQIKALQFTPSTVTAHIGDTIIWKNADMLSHSATSPAKIFDSHEIKPGKSARWVVTKKGSLTYMCSFHPTMKGAIVVK